MKWEDRPQVLADILPTEKYTLSDLINLRAYELPSAIALLQEAKSKGQLPYIKVRMRHEIKGSDILTVLKGEHCSRTTKRERATEIAASFTQEDVINLVLERETLTKARMEARRGRSTVKTLKAELQAVKKRLLRIKQTEEEKTEILKAQVLKNIFQGQKVSWLAASEMNLCGIYFLINKGNIVYIGQSVFIPSRIRQHRVDKTFDEIRFLLFKQEELNERELFFIQLIQPPLNGQYKKNPNKEIHHMTMTQ